MMYKTIKNSTLLGSFLLVGILSNASVAVPNNDSSNSWYVGGGLGQSSMNPDGGNTWEVIEDSDLSKKLYVGKNISPQIGLEAFWADFGDAELASTLGKTGKVNYNAVGANVVYNLPYKIAGVRPLGKLGVAKFNNKDKDNVQSTQLNNLTIFGALGAEYDLTNNLSLRSEYEYFDKDISQVSIGLNWRPDFGNRPYEAKKPIAKAVVTPQPAPEKITEIVPVYVPKTEVISIYNPAPPVVKKAPAPAPVRAPAPKKPQYRIVHKALSGGSNFASGSAQLTYNGKSALDQMANNLQNQKMSLRSIQIDGHTDSVGSTQSNQVLSYNRARSVANYLVSKGISQHLIRTQGFGESQPIANNNTQQGRSKNRRVEIRIKGTSKEVVQ